MQKLLILSITLIALLTASASFAAGAPEQMPVIKPDEKETYLEGKKLNVAWTKNWGTNASMAELHINGKHIPSVDKTLTASEEPGSWQGDSFTIDDITAPSVNITNPQVNVKVVLKNDAGSTSSESVTLGGIKPLKLSSKEFSFTSQNDATSLTKSLQSKVSGGIEPYFFTVESKPSKGTVSFDGAEFTYTPSAGSVADDSFAFYVKDSSEPPEQTDTATVNIKTDNWKCYEYYSKRGEVDIMTRGVGKDDPSSFIHYWESMVTGPDSNIKDLEDISYYVQVKSLKEDGTPYDLSKITETVSYSNPPNVNRVIKLMPKEKFEAWFPHTAFPEDKVVNGFCPGKTYSYHNFLKAVAVMPAYCGDYSNYPGVKAEDMKTEEGVNRIAKKFLATTMAHGVQETFNGLGSSLTPDWETNNSGFTTKAGGAFGNVTEMDKAEYPDGSGPFSPAGKMHYLTDGNWYFGRGAKQLSHPVNYANTSLLLYGDLRLVKYPQLAEEGILPYLTSITYALIPKTSQPSLAEVMDGAWKRKVLANNPDLDEEGYDGFPLTVLIVNGAYEGSGNTNEGYRANSKVRIDAYNHFSTATEPITIKYPHYLPNGGIEAREKTVQPLLDPEVTYDVDASDGYYNVYHRYPNRIQILPRYYYLNQDGVQSWDTSIQTFGGRSVHENIKF